MLRITQSRELQCRLGQNARARILSQFNLDYHILQWMELCKEVLAGRQSNKLADAKLRTGKGLQRWSSQISEL